MPRRTELRRGRQVHQSGRTAHDPDDSEGQRRLEAARGRQGRDLLHLPPRQPGAGTDLVQAGRPGPQGQFHRQPQWSEQALAGGGRQRPAQRPLLPYLLDAKAIRVNSTTALANGNRASIQQAEHTFGLMMHFSTSLGVNCTYCHNTSQIGSGWAGNPPQLVTAWYGIRMMREVNNDYMAGLTDTFPSHRKVCHRRRRQGELR